MRNRDSQRGLQLIDWVAEKERLQIELHRVKQQIQQTVDDNDYTKCALKAEVLALTHFL